MMKQFLFVFLIVQQLPGIGVGQNLDRSIISAAYSSSPNGEWLLGETVIGDFNGEKNILNNGFLQGLIPPSTTSIETRENISILLYPNPSAGWIQISYHSLETMDLKIYDLSGQLQIDRKNLGFNENLDLTDLPAGTYVLRCQNANQFGEQLIVKL